MDTLEEVLAAELVARRRLNLLQAHRDDLARQCRDALKDLNALKVSAYRLGFSGNIMRDADGNRVNILALESST